MFEISYVLSRVPPLVKVVYATPTFSRFIDESCPIEDYENYVVEKENTFASSKVKSIPVITIQNTNRPVVSSLKTKTLRQYSLCCLIPFD